MSCNTEDDTTPSIKEVSKPYHNSKSFVYFVVCFCCTRTLTPFIFQNKTKEKLDLLFVVEELKRRMEAKRIRNIKAQLKHPKLTEHQKKKFEELRERRNKVAHPRTATKKN